jgi:hypothetical protein
MAFYGDIPASLTKRNELLASMAETLDDALVQSEADALYQSILSEGSFVDGDKTKLDYITATQAVDLDMVALEQTDIASLRNTKQLSQAIHMTAASSGSNGIQIANNDDINFGTGDFTISFLCSLQDWDPGVATILWYVISDSNNYIQVLLASTGTISLKVKLSGSIYHNTFSDGPPADIANNKFAQITISVKRETEFVDGLTSIYINKELLYTSAIPMQTPADFSIDPTLYMLGTVISRIASTTLAAYVYNRALSADGVADLYERGVAWEDMGASQTVLTSGALTIGKNYTIDTFETGDDFTNVGAASNADGVGFTATGTTPTTWTNGSSLRNPGCTLQLEPENIQPASGQWLDSSGNGHHAKMPAEGCTLMRPESRFEIRWTNTWAGTSESQYVGGVNEDIFPSDNVFIEYIIWECTATGVNGILGDGSDTDRFVESTALAAYTNCTIANRTHDGTNRKFVIGLNGNFTGSITTTLVGRIL